MQNSPFKFLDSFTKDDRGIFFGRDKEIEELHSRAFESKILIVYGTSGTGKTSLINCGLANKFSDTDWLPVNIRRRGDINQSLIESLFKSAISTAPFEKALTSKGKSYNLVKLLRSVYLDHFKPIFLIFDQFEELFIFGQKEEKDELIRNIRAVIDSDAQCRFIFALREEYLAGITEFEKVIPSFLSNRIRIEKMTRQNAIQTIEGPCRVNNIQIEPGFASELLEKLNPDSPEVELTWLQVYLDKIFRMASSPDGVVNSISRNLLNEAGDVKDVLGAFLEEQISQLSDPETGLIILKSFVSSKGTKRQITEEEVIEYTRTFGKSIENDVIRGAIQKFIGLRILRDKDENERYELRHDSLATKIYEKITLVEKELLEIKSFIENAYNNYEKRNLFLSEEDLKYIAPYEDKLFLSEKSLRFISQSKWAIQRKRRSRQNILIASAAIIISILTFFTVWAMRERSNAVNQQQMAEDQKDAALRAKAEADSAKQEAILSKKIAEGSARIALTARNQAETAKGLALSASENAIRQKNRAEELSVIANEQARKAEAEKGVADQQRTIAQAAQEKANRLSLLSLAQTLALKVMSNELKPEANGLVAVQAYRFNIANGGSADDPVIFKALDRAYNILDSSKHSIKEHLYSFYNEVSDVVEFRSGVAGVDQDGNIILSSYISKGLLKMSDKVQQDFIEFISLGPGCNSRIICYDNKKLVFQKIIMQIPKFSTEDTELKGHNGSIKTAAWSFDNKYLVTGGNDSLILLWDTENITGNPVKSFKAVSALKALAFTGSGSIISAHSDGSIMLWNINSSSGEMLFARGAEEPLSLGWNDSRKTILAGCSNGTILIINISNKPYNISRFTSHSSGIDHLVISNDYSMMATSGWDKVIKLYNYKEFFENGNSVKGVVNFNDIDARVRSLKFTSDNKLVAAMSDKTIRVWETSSEKLVSSICNLVNRDMTQAEWSDIIGIEIQYEKTCSGNQ